MSKRLWTVGLAVWLIGAAGCAPETDDLGGQGADSGFNNPGNPDASSTPGAIDASTAPGAIDASTTLPPSPDAGVLPPGATLGDACSCDSDCPNDGSHAGICVYGVCMTRASGTCSAAGSTAECGAGSRCWGLQGVDGYICWPDCSSYSCAGVCDSDGSCAPTSSTDCDYTCGTYCNCTPGDCGTNEQCVSGQCLPTTSGAGPGPGPGPSCPSLPPMSCSGSAAYCGQLIQFNPSLTTAYDDYPINGESSATQYRSWLRRDHVMLLKYATALVACKAAAWNTGNGGPLGLGDMSESNGAIPGTSINSPGHPPGTHINGRDIDVGYYQIGQANNRLRAICDHYNSSGVDQLHCTAAPTILDVWRSALFFGTMFQSPILRVIGVDGKAGPQLVTALNELCTTGWLPQAACQNIALAYEVTDTGLNWFLFHHHHAHISTESQAPFWQPDTNVMPCFGPGCTGKPFKSNPHLFQAK